MEQWNGNENKGVGIAIHNGMYLANFMIKFVQLLALCHTNRPGRNRLQFTSGNSSC